MTSRHRLALTAILLVAAIGVALPASISPVLAAEPQAASSGPVVDPDRRTAEAPESSAEAPAESSSWAPTIAKIFNFAVLVGVLAYFLRAPIREYLSGRHHSIRRDLAEARSLRDASEARLEAVQIRMAQLPDELAALEKRGREELVSERERMKAAASAERDALLARTRREIDLQFRTARRELVEHTADLAMDLTRRRIEAAITSEDHARLFNRYEAEVRS